MFGHNGGTAPAWSSRPRLHGMPVTRAQGDTVMRVEPAPLFLLHDVRLPQQSWPTLLSPRSLGTRQCQASTYCACPLLGHCRGVASVHGSVLQSTAKGLRHAAGHLPPDTSRADILGYLWQGLPLTRRFCPASVGNR